MITVLFFICYLRYEIEFRGNVFLRVEINVQGTLAIKMIIVYFVLLTYSNFI